MSNEIDVRLIGNYTVELNEQGPPGAPGLGIASVTEVGYDSNTGIHTYRITYTNGTHYDFEISGAIEYTEGEGIDIIGTTISIDNSVIPNKTELQSALSEKQDKIDAGNKLSSDLVDDTGNTNKFATQSQLDQISTNQSDISTINSKISDSASSSNKLIDKNYVDTEDGDLQDQINNLKSRGRFLALWNCATGLAETNPPQSPYTYHTGDYFIIGTVSDSTPQVNYKPSGPSYTTGVASSTVETNTVDVDDVYYYDGTSWHLQVNTQKTTSFVNIAGSPYDNTNLATALNGKQNELTFSTGLTNTSDTITVTDYDKLIKNDAVGNNAIVIGGSDETVSAYSVVLGDGAKAGSLSPYIHNAQHSIAIGSNAKSMGQYAIQIGDGENLTNRSFNVGFGKDNSLNTLEYTLLDGFTGLIPDARLSSNIARTSAIPIVNDGTITLTQGGTTKGSFTVNQSGDTTIDLDAGGGSQITVDDHLDSNSTNPVQNKIVTEALGGKQDALTAGNGINIGNETFSEPASTLGNSSWNRVKRVNNMLIAMSGNNSINLGYSTNGTKWTTAMQGGLRNRSWYGISYDGSKYVALDENGYITTSTNGTTWTYASQVSNLGSRQWKGLAYDGSKFVAISSTGYVSTSTDGTTWTSASQNANLGNHTWFDLIYDGAKFIAISSTGYLSTSTNGTTWTTATQNTNLGNNSWRAIEYNGSMYVALGYSGDISTSSDGENWTTAVRNANLSTVTNWCGIAYINNKFFALERAGSISSWDGSDGDLLIKVIADSSLSSTSRNPVQNKVINTALSNKQDRFTAQSPLQMNNNYLQLIIDTQLNSKSSFPVTNSAITQAINNIHIPEYQAGTSISIIQGQPSYDFDNQNAFTPTKDSTQWHGITYNNGVYVAVGESNHVITSTDGNNWNLVNGEQGGWGGDTLTGVAYDGTNVCVAITSYRTIYCAQDFDLWNYDEIQDANQLNAIAYGNNTFVIVGQDQDLNGLISYGSGAQGDWSNVATPQTITNILDVIYDGTRFVAGCSSGYIGVSTDGSSWTFTQIDNSQNDIKSIAYNGTDYVTIVDNNLVLKSSDLTTWTSTRVSSIGNNSVIDSAGGNGYFVFLVEDLQNGGYAIYVSSNGSTWNVYSLSTGNITYCIANCGNDFLMGQEWGYIISIVGDAALTINCLVDNQLNSTSTNPVQNRVLYNIIGDIETLLQGI